jgi:hypothetical protein
MPIGWNPIFLEVLSRKNAGSKSPKLLLEMSATFRTTSYYTYYTKRMWRYTLGDLHTPSRKFYPKT